MSASDIMDRLAEPGSAIMVDWTFEHYLHAHEFTSRSALEDLREGPALYHAKHIAKSIRTETTPAMEFGSNVHLALLEPEEWARRLYPTEPPRPAGAHGRAKAGTPEKTLYNEWTEAVEQWKQGQASDSIIVDPKGRAAIEAITASVKSHKTGAWAFRSKGSNEQTILWHHAETGILLRCRLDRLIWHDAHTVAIVDLKTTKDPSPTAFAKAIANFGYHRQAAIYLDAVRALAPEAELHYELIAVRSSAPFETACYTLRETREGPDGSTLPGPLALGRAQYTETLHELASRRKSNDWKSDWQIESMPIDLPYWAYRTP